MEAISLPSLIIPSASVVVAFTSPLIGPSTIEVISLSTSLKSRPSFAIRDGLVVTPQITPMSFALRISSTLAVSIKNFITLPPRFIILPKPLQLRYIITDEIQIKA